MDEYDADDVDNNQALILNTTLFSDVITSITRSMWGGAGITADSLIDGLTSQYLVDNNSTTSLQTLDTGEWTHYNSNYPCHSNVCFPLNSSFVSPDSDEAHQTNTSEALAIMAIKGLLLTALVTMTIIGNVLVLLAVFVNAHLRSTTHYFIANLAVADLLLGTAVLPFSASLEVLDSWVFGQLFCDIWAAVDVLCCTASIMSLCVISIDRYIGVTRPLQHCSIMTERRAAFVIVLVWVLAVAISVAPLLGWKDPPANDPNVCHVTKQLGYVLFSVSGSFYVPLMIILAVYFRVYQEARKQSRFLKTGVKTAKPDISNTEITLRIHKGPSGSGGSVPQSKQPAAAPYQSSSSSEHSDHSARKPISKMTLAGKVAKFKREQKAAKTLGIVVGVFILCWFPFFFVLPLESLCRTCHIPVWLFKIIFWLGYSNSMLNPIIYACSSRQFKRAFIRILACKWRRRPRNFLPDVATLPQSPGRGQWRLTRSMQPSSCLFRWIDRFRQMTRKHSRLPLTYRSGRRSHRIDTTARYYTPSYNPTVTRYDKDSPIYPLRFIHDGSRKETMDSVMISDDESGAVHEESDQDERNYSLANSRLEDYVAEHSVYIHTERTCSLPNQDTSKAEHSKCEHLDNQETSNLNQPQDAPENAVTSSTGAAIPANDLVNDVSENSLSDTTKDRPQVFRSQGNNSISELDIHDRDMRDVVTSCRNGAYSVYDNGRTSQPTADSIRLDIDNPCCLQNSMQCDARFVSNSDHVGDWSKADRPVLGGDCSKHTDDYKQHTNKCDIVQANSLYKDMEYPNNPDQISANLSKTETSNTSEFPVFELDHVSQFDQIQAVSDDPTVVANSNSEQSTSSVNSDVDIIWL